MPAGQRVTGRCCSKICSYSIWWNKVETIASGHLRFYYCPWLRWEEINWQLVQWNVTVNRRCYFNEVVYEEISQLLVEEAMVKERHNHILFFIIRKWIFISPSTPIFFLYLLQKYICSNRKIGPIYWALTMSLTMSQFRELSIFLFS